MGWGQIPGEARAAEEARRAAVELAESRPMSPFERTLIGVLEDIRDAVQACRPVPLEPIVGVAMSTGLDPLLDSPPAVLARSITAAGAALSNSFPMFREDLTEAGFEKFAEVAIEAALHEAARDRDTEEPLAPAWRVGGPPDTSPSVQQQQQVDEPAGGAPSPESPPAGAPD